LACGDVERLRCQVLEGGEVRVGFIGNARVVQYVLAHRLQKGSRETNGSLLVCLAPLHWPQPNLLHGLGIELFRGSGHGRVARRRPSAFDALKQRPKLVP